eukprot:359900-Chlamydomonas_euryale.AAC.1
MLRSFSGRMLEHGCPLGDQRSELQRPRHSCVRVHVIVWVWVCVGIAGESGRQLCGASRGVATAACRCAACDFFKAAGRV